MNLTDLWSDHRMRRVERSLIEDTARIAHLEREIAVLRAEVAGLRRMLVTYVKEDDA